MKSPYGHLSIQVNAQNDEIQGLAFIHLPCRRTLIVPVIAFTPQPILKEEFHLPSPLVVWFRHRHEVNSLYLWWDIDICSYESNVKTLLFENS